MCLDVITQVKTLDAELEQARGSEHGCRVTLLRGDGHGIRPQHLGIVTVIDEA